jgi:uncharacterized delta-60 repeat protein
VGGIVVTALRQDPWSVLTDAVVLPDGRVLAVGQGYPPDEGFSERTFLAARFTSAGALDPTFGAGGVVVDRDLSGARSVALHSDGRFIVALGGITYSARRGIARFLPDGGLDPSFGDDGVADIGIPQGTAVDIALDAQGRVVAACTSLSVEGQYQYFDFAAARLTTEGTLDPSFSGNGWATFRISPYDDIPMDMAVLPDGRILLAGEASGDAVLVRLTADGALDPSFDGDGLARTTFGQTFAQGRAVALQTDGRAVLGGGTDAFQGLARFEHDGRPDTTFGAGGVVRVDGVGLAEGLALQLDGRLVTIGSAGPAADLDVLVRRYDPDGAPDASFGEEGAVRTDFGWSDVGTAVSLDTDGRIVAAAVTSRVGEGASFALARYLGGGGVPAEGGPVSADVSLHLPRPNPARADAAVAFDLPLPATVRLTVIDAVGRRVATLVDGQRAAGRHEVTWEAGALAPGVYLLRLEAAGYVHVRRVSVVR